MCIGQNMDNAACGSSKNDIKSHPADDSAFAQYPAAKAGSNCRSCTETRIQVQILLMKLVSSLAYSEIVKLVKYFLGWVRSSFLNLPLRESLNFLLRESDHGSWVRMDFKDISQNMNELELNASMTFGRIIQTFWLQIEISRDTSHRSLRRKLRQCKYDFERLSNRSIPDLDTILDSRKSCSVRHPQISWRKFGEFQGGKSIKSSKHCSHLCKISEDAKSLPPSHSDFDGGNPPSSPLPGHSIRVWNSHRSKNPVSFKEERR